MALPFAVDDYVAPERAATEHPASVLFEKYAHGREEDFSKSCLQGRIAGWAARKYLCAITINHKGRALPPPQTILSDKIEINKLPSKPIIFIF